MELTHLNTRWVTLQAAEIPELLEVLISNFSCCGPLLTTVSNFAQADVSVKKKESLQQLLKYPNHSNKVILLQHTFV